jgi:translation initiation factor RLI1
MEAIAVKNDDVAQVNEALCIGCGVCIPTCDAEAVALMQRGEINPPPDLEKFFTARYKAEETT